MVNRKGFCRYIGSKRKVEENKGALLHGAGDPVRKDMEKTEVLHVGLFFFFPWFSLIWSALRLPSSPTLQE